MVKKKLTVQLLIITVFIILEKNHHADPYCFRLWATSKSEARLCRLKYCSFPRDLAANVHAHRSSPNLRWDTPTRMRVHSAQVCANLAKFESQTETCACVLALPFEFRACAHFGYRPSQFARLTQTAVTKIGTHGSV